MDRNTALQLLQTMIDYLEAGNQESDRYARSIMEWDSDNIAFWRKELERLRDEGEWTGLRAPEAEFLAAALRFLQQQLTTGTG